MMFSYVTGLENATMNKQELVVMLKQLCSGFILICRCSPHFHGEKVR